jgi:Rnl2 family RNA ligase
MQPVQVGVWYAPDLHFMAFDVVVETHSGRRYLPFDTAADLCARCGFMFAEALFRGTLAECLKFEIEFETKIPGRLRLPPLPSGASHERNLAEGCVVRPTEELPVQIAGIRVGKESMRGLFKRKIPQFSEKRYQNDDWKKGKAGEEVHYGMTPEELVCIEVAASVTEQRLDNVLSKIGRVDIRDQEACRRLLEDLKKDVRDSLEDADLEILRGSANLEAELDKLARSLIKGTLLGKRRQNTTSFPAI